ncbi:MAG: hypothetical protein ACSLFR_08140 [Solirubrobacteraceae bacterium]
MYAVLLAVASLLVLPAAPTYDPWAWLVWGRELWSLDLSTAEGPAFKPLPVAVCALLTPLGDGAPTAWVVLARAGAISSVVLAGGLGWRLAGGVSPRVAALLAGAAVVLTAGFVRLSAAGSSEGLLLALALGALLAVLDARWRLALALLAACCLLRVEAWPFALVAVALRWRAAPPRERGALTAGVIAVPALWFGPEWLGSGDPMRSGARARVPNPGQPALADLPAWASVRDAALLVFWPVLLGLVGLRRDPRALAPAAIGLAWVALVAVMAQAGFSGEARYALPGIALIAVSGAVGIARLGPAGTALAAACVAVAVVPRAGGLVRDHEALGYQARMQADLGEAIAAAGGPDALARCGRPVTGPYRGTLVAWHLRVEKRRVGFPPEPGRVVLASALTRGAPVEPAIGSRAAAVRAGTWRIETHCPGRTA